MRAASTLFFLLLFTITSHVGFSEEYSLTLYTIPSRSQIDFSTPGRLAWTASKNALTLHASQRKNAMGHVFIELNSPGYNVITGSTKQRLFASGRRELLNGYGYGILFHGIEGKLEFDGALARDLPTHYHHGDIAFIKALISREQFERLTYYLEEYQRRGYDTIYNGLNRPREGLGAGCTAFGMSFFEVAGIQMPEWEERWAVNVRIPYRLIGGPWTGNIVSLREVFSSMEWAGEDEPHRIFRIIDPYLIYEWIREVWGGLTLGMDEFKPGEDAGYLLEPVSRGRAKGLLYDFTGFPVPDEPVFLPASEVLR